MKIGNIIEFVIILLIVVGLYYKGCSYRPSIGDIKIKPICPTIDLTGSYELALNFEEPIKNSYVKQKMEIFYMITINKDECNISGIGFKSKDVITDTISHLRKTNPYKKEYYIVELKGQIDEDKEVVNLEITRKISSNQDHKTKITLPKQNFNANSFSGNFVEELNKCRGSVKFTKISLNN